MTGFILSEKELRELTGKVRKKSQQRELQFMGIDYTIRSDGMPVVFRNSIISNDADIKQPIEPNWDMINA